MEYETAQKGLETYPASSQQVEDSGSCLSDSTSVLNLSYRVGRRADQGYIELSTPAS